MVLCALTLLCPSCVRRGRLVEHESLAEIWLGQSSIVCVGVSSFRVCLPIQGSLRRLVAVAGLVFRVPVRLVFASESCRAWAQLVCVCLDSLCILPWHLSTISATTAAGGGRPTLVCTVASSSRFHVCDGDDVSSTHIVWQPRLAQYEGGPSAGL